MYVRTFDYFRAYVRTLYSTTSVRMLCSTTSTFTRCDAQSSGSVRISNRVETLM